MRFGCAVPKFPMSSGLRSAWSETNPGSAPPAGSISGPMPKRPGPRPAGRSASGRRRIMAASRTKSPRRSTTRTIVSCYDSRRYSLPASEAVPSAADSICSRHAVHFKNVEAFNARPRAAPAGFMKALRRDPQEWSHEWSGVLQIPFRFNFRPYRSAWCDSKANFADQSELSPHLIVNFSFTNQRADSFSASGVNLEAKV
jgi:hypothetical protein